MSYCIYLRKSRADIEAEARGEGETLARHRYTLLTLAENMGLSVGCIYQEIVSGDSIANRPVMQHLLHEVEDGKWQGVLVMEVERLARGDTIDQGMVARAFEYSHTHIITPAKTYDPADEFDSEYFEFGLFMSRREYKTIKRRLARGKQAAVAEGQYLGTVPPYGYTKAVIDGKRTLIPHPQQADTVQLIFSSYTCGHAMSTQQISTLLNQMGVPAAKGGPWTAGAVRNILRNPVYTGTVTQDKTLTVRTVKNGQVMLSHPCNPTPHLYPALHPPLVEPAVFAMAQDKRTRKAAGTAPTPRALTNPLAGLVVCGCCGRTMVRRPYPHKPDMLMCPQSGCETASCRLQLAEEKILLAADRLLKGIDLPVALPHAGAQSRAALKAVINAGEKTLAEKRKQAAALCDLLETGIYTPTLYRERLQTLQAAMVETKASLQTVRQMLQQPEDASARSPRAGSCTFMEAYAAATTPAQKNALLKTVLQKVVYRKSKQERWKADGADAFCLTLHPLLPPAPYGEPQDGISLPSLSTPTGS